MKVVFPAPRSPVRITQVAGPQGRARAAPRTPGCPPAWSWSARARTASPSGGSRPSRSATTNPWCSQKRIVPGSSTRATMRSPSQASSRACASAALTSIAATPDPSAEGSTPTRRNPSAVPTGSKISDPTGRPSSSATSPPYSPSSAATESSVSDNAEVGGSSGGRAPKAAWITARTSAAASAPTTRTRGPVTGPRSLGFHRLVCLGGRDQLVEGGVDLLVAFEDHHVSGPFALEEG